MMFSPARSDTKPEEPKFQPEIDTFYRMIKTFQSKKECETYKKIIKNLEANINTLEKMQKNEIITQGEHQSLLERHPLRANSDVVSYPHIDRLARRLSKT